MQRLTERLKKIERRRRVGPGGLPTIIIVPDGPKRAQVLADVERRRARGERVFLVTDGDNPLMADGLMDFLS